jgi:nicotinate-nucleotide adenylyltransferase
MARRENNHVKRAWPWFKTGYSMKIGILGGTFNPLHKGHLFLARSAKKALGLDKVIFVPAYVPPHKNSAGIIHAEKRFYMIRLAISGEPDFAVSRYEIDKKKRVYSVDTISYFKRKFPKKTQLFFLAGADSLNSLSLWKDIDTLLNLCEFVVFSRPGSSLKIKQKKISSIQIKALDISSTQVRMLVKNNNSIKRLVPVPVERYIKKKGLYR